MFVTALILVIFASLFAVAALRRTQSGRNALNAIETAPPRTRVGVAADEGPRTELSRNRVTEVVEDEQPTEQERAWQDLSAEQAAAFIVGEAPRILDVRTAQETMYGVIPGAIPIPVQELAHRIDELPRDERPTLVYCAHGVRSIYACDLLGREGFEGLYNLSGGVAAWNQPLERAGSPQRAEAAAE